MSTTNTTTGTTTYTTSSNPLHINNTNSDNFNNNNNFNNDNFNNNNFNSDNFNNNNFNNDNFNNNNFNNDNFNNNNDNSNISSNHSNTSSNTSSSTSSITSSNHSNNSSAAHDSYMIDIAGIKYELTGRKARHFFYRSRSDFINDFKGMNINEYKIPFDEIEYILKKYMSPRISKKEQQKMIESGDDKDKLIKILESRADRLLNSISIKGPIVTVIPLQKSHNKLLELIREIKEYKSSDIPNTTNINNSVINIMEIDEDHLIECILEMSWLLLDTESDTQNKDVWSKYIKDFDKIRLQDIIKLVKKRGMKPHRIPTNYFDTIINNMPEANKENKENIKERIEILLNIIILKRYYDMGKSHEKNENKDTLMYGGAHVTIFNKPIGNVMNPIFEYFKVLYDPIYTFLEGSISSYILHKNHLHKIKNVIIPSLLTLHHICNNIKKYGAYRIINMDDDVISFINHIIHDTKNADVAFNDKIFQLPKIYLSTLLYKSNIHEYPNTLHNIQLYTGNNITFNNSKNTSIFNEITSFFNKNNIYLVHTNSTNIPINLYEINFNKVDMYSQHIVSKKLNNNYLNTKTPRLFLNSVMSLHNNFNNALITLSIFIAFKELVSK